MKTKSITIKSISILLACSMMLQSGCVSSTLIQSNPPGARVFLNAEPVGTTPYAHQDTKIVGSCTIVRIEKDGYEPFITNMCRNEEADVGAIIGGFFLLFPFLWTMKYKPTRTYELAAASQTRQDAEIKPERAMTPSMAERLRELKDLFDDGILTEEEYEKAKKRVLEGDI
jgi:hypothetical protein